MGVVITETETAKPKEKVFDSLFHTPGSGSVTSGASPTHSAAAITLNPPGLTPRKSHRSPHTPHSSVALASPTRSYCTAQPSPATSSRTTERFVSCDALHLSDSPPA